MDPRGIISYLCLSSTPRASSSSTSAGVAEKLFFLKCFPSELIRKLYYFLID